MINDRSKFTRASLRSINYYCDSLSGSVIKLFFTTWSPSCSTFYKNRW